jgi:hypothetical protein
MRFVLREAPADLLTLSEEAGSHKTGEVTFPYLSSQLILTIPRGFITSQQDGKISHTLP